MERYQYMSLITEEMVKHKIPKRPENAHKGDFGKLFVLCGSKAMPGAALFVANSAVRSGVGLVRLCSVKSVYEKVQNFEPTFVIVDEDEDGFMKKNSLELILSNLNLCSCGVVGCGLGLTDDTKFLVYEIIKNSSVPLVIDADGINAISENIDILKETKSEIILTPHVKEMERLIGVETEVINKDKIKYAGEFAQQYGVVMVLKGPKTVVCDKEGNIFVNTSGNEGMAKGGSGDVLSGIIGSLVSQSVSLLDAAVCGVYIHGLAGDICKKKLSSVSMLPSDIINELPSVFLKFGL